MSFHHFSFQGLFVLVTLHIGLGGVAHAAPLVYDFESLFTGNLAGQDNWLKHGFTTEATVVTGTGSNSTQVLRTSNGTGIWYRTNDSSFSFPGHSVANTEATMQVDVRYANLPGSDYFFALGAGNGASTSRGPGFGIGMGGNFLIREFGGTISDVLNLPVPSSVSNGDWLRLQHVIDFTANNGNGAGRLFYQNLTAGDTGFTEFTTAPVNLRIQEMASSVRNPATWDSMVVVLSGSGAGTNAQFDNLTANVPRPPSTVYTFEGLTNGSLTGQDGWTTYLGNSAFDVVDAADAGINASKAALAVSTPRPNFSVRPNDENFNFPLHSAVHTAATFQFDIKASLESTASTYFGLAGDVDATSGINSTSERSPAFGIINGQFGIQHLGNDTAFSALGAPASKGVAEGDWLQMQMIVDFTADSGNGAATVQYKNLTQGQTTFTQLTTAPVHLGLKDRYVDSYAAMQDPANWDTMMIVRANQTAMQVDNLIANLPPEPSTVYTFEGLTNGSLTGQDGWTTYLSNSAFSVTDGLGANTSEVAVGSASTSFSVRENDVNWHFAPHSGDIAAMQFDLRFMPGTNDPRNNSGVYFGLAADVDSTEGINTLNERGPAFGILQSQFGIQHLGSSASPVFLGRPDDDFGVAAGDWLRMQLLIDTSSSADGLGTLYFMNLTQGDLGWTHINDAPVNMGLTSRYTGTYAAMQNPANWDTMMMVRAFSVGLQVDNLVPNAVPIPEPGSVLLAAFGLLGFGLLRRRRTGG